MAHTGTPGSGDEWSPQIAHSLGCDNQTVRNVIKAFNEKGLACLTRGSSRPHTIRVAFDSEGVERLRDLLRHSPRSLGKSTSLWTLELAAEVSFEKGLTASRVSAETARATLARLLVRWVTDQGRSHEQTWLRFVDGRPVSGITIAFLEWSCHKLLALGKKALLLVWDRASWHISAQVR